MKFPTLLLAAASLLAAQIPLRAQTGGTTEEPALIAILQSDHSAHDKDAACARLKHIGTEAAIPALAALLTDEALSHSARYALEAMPSQKAGQALMEALPKTTGANRVGIINSLGERGDQRAVAPLAALLADPDAATATAAAETLGKIGGPEAQHALDTALKRAIGPVREAVVDALLRCATATHDRAEFQKLYATGKSETVRLLTQDADVKLTNAQRLEAFKNLLADPLKAAEKRTLLAGLATLKDTAALELTLSLIDDPEVHQEASQAAQKQTPHSFKKIKLSDQFWDEGANFGDFNHDGQMDIVSGPFWYEAPDFKQRHEYRPATATFQHHKADGGIETITGFEGALGTNNAYSDDFLTFVYDFNGDGWPDILVIDYPGKAAHWFENPKGASGPWPSHLLLNSVVNESPTFLDINGDGKPELVCNHDGYFGYAAADWSEPSKPWKFHPITPKGKWGKFTHGLGVGDVNGDGRMDLLERDGWWEQPPSLTNDPVWTFHPFPFAPGGAAQMFAYDVNGDGLNDVITCLNPHGYGLVWWEQMRNGTNSTFKQHVIAAQNEAGSRFGVHFSQPHSMALVDVDGDGLLDIVTGKRFWAHGRNGPDPESHDFPAVLYWFQLVRHANGQADFVPHLIDDDSGVGTEVVAGKIVNQKYPDIVVGNKKGTFLFTHEVKP